MNKIVTIAEIDEMIKVNENIALNASEWGVLQKWKADKLAMLEEIDKLLCPICIKFPENNCNRCNKFKKLKQSLGGGK